MKVLKLLVLVLVWKVALSSMLQYQDYLPPDFSSGFLRGREPYFWGPYCGAFYVHILAGPLSLLLGTLLVTEPFRRRYPSWHRRLGRWQVGCILLGVVPGGFWMARYAETGAVAGVGLASLAVATAVCTVAGWHQAVAGRLASHRRWMRRTFALLCSAVVIRVLGGAATLAELDAPWLYPAAAWVSWLAPLLILELASRVKPGKPAPQPPGPVPSLQARS